MKKSGGILSWSENGFERGVALVTQDPWLQKGTVRANITFGRPFAKQFYDHVIEACALDSDFQVNFLLLLKVEKFFIAEILPKKTKWGLGVSLWV